MFFRIADFRLSIADWKSYQPSSFSLQQAPEGSSLKGES
jgi:hypothetical protein